MVHGYVRPPGIYPLSVSLVRHRPVLRKRRLQRSQQCGKTCCSKWLSRHGYGVFVLNIGWYWLYLVIFCDTGDEWWINGVPQWFSMPTWLQHLLASLLSTNIYHVQRGCQRGILPDWPVCASPGLRVYFITWTWSIPANGYFKIQNADEPVTSRFFPQNFQTHPWNLR